MSRARREREESEGGRGGAGGGEDRGDERGRGAWGLRVEPRLSVGMLVADLLVLLLPCVAAVPALPRTSPDLPSDPVRLRREALPESSEETPDDEQSDRVHIIVSYFISFFKAPRMH